MARPPSDRPAARRTMRGLALPVALLALWEISSRAGLIDPRFLPPLEKIAQTAWTETLHDGLFMNLGASLARNLVGFAIGAALGIVFGAGLGLSRTANQVFGPTFHAARQIAVLAWIPIISIWFGFAETAKIVFIAIAAFVPVAMNTQEGVESASRQFVEVARAAIQPPSALHPRIPAVGRTVDP